jgi:hypothetical protein
MRTTLNLDDDLIRQAREVSGIQEKTALIHTALRELIARGAARRLAAPCPASTPDGNAGRWMSDDAGGYLGLGQSLRSADSVLVNSHDGLVGIHPFVIGETRLRMGTVPRRS